MTYDKPTDPNLDRAFCSSEVIMTRTPPIRCIRATNLPGFALMQARVACARDLPLLRRLIELRCRVLQRAPSVRPQIHHVAAVDDVEPDRLGI